MVNRVVRVTRMDLFSWKPGHLVPLLPVLIDKILFEGVSRQNLLLLLFQEPFFDLL
jgi:hypothetical protein